VGIQYTKSLHCKTLQNIPKFGFLVWKYMYVQSGNPGLDPLSIAMQTRFSEVRNVGRHNVEIQINI
jgi:hypothetical protein